MAAMGEPSDRVSLDARKLLINMAKRLTDLSDQLRTLESDAALAGLCVRPTNTHMHIHMHTHTHVIILAPD
jgi:hypothetical protein